MTVPAAGTFDDLPDLDDFDQKIRMEPLQLSMQQTMVVICQNSWGYTDIDYMPQSIGSHRLFCDYAVLTRTECRGPMGAVS